MKSLSDPSHTPTRPRSNRWSVCLAAALICLGSGAQAQTYFDMSTANYSQNFADIANWTNNYASGIGSNNWRTATSVTTSPGTNFTVFTTATSGGVQKGTGAIVFLATGTNAGATDLLLNFSGRIAGNLSFDYAKIANTAVATPRTSDLKIQYSLDNGLTFTDVSGYSIPRITNNDTPETGSLNITLPSALNNQSQVVIRFYFWNNTQTGGSGNRPKWSVDNIAVTSTSSTADTTPPEIATLTPADDATNVPVASTTALMVGFSEPVVKGTGDITVYQTATDFMIATIGVNTAAVLFEGNVANITLPSNLDPSTGYYVNISAGAFKDAANNNFAGIAGKTTWNFTTGTTDITAPAIVTLSPADDSSSAAPTSNLVITYDEPVFANSGSLVIKRFADDSTVETIPVPGALVSVSGATVTVNPASVLQYGTGYYVEIAAGSFRDAANNSTLAVTGNAAWNFTTRNLSPVVISQYYEGTTSADRYIELKNTTASPVSLTGYRIAAWSDTSPSDNEGWKSGTNTTARVTSLDGFSIPANGNFLIVEPGAGVPGYAANNFDLETDSVNLSATDFDGDDSIVLYNGSGFSQAEIVDALSISAGQATDKSIYRTSDTLQGYDLNSGTSFLNFPGTWATKTLTEVNNATITDAWYLNAVFPPKTLTLGLLSSTLQESSGSTTATITRTGSFAAAAFVTVTASINGVVQFTEPVEIPINTGTANFTINTIDNPWLSGNQAITIQVSCPGYTPGNAPLTVLDDAGDVVLPVVINEVDSDQAVVATVNDGSEFIELYNNSNQAVSLDGVVLVLYNGGSTAVPSQASYLTLDLTGQVIPANGFLVVGNPGVTNVSSVTFDPNKLQNGQDAVALYVGNAASYPNGTLANAAPGYLVDAVVYETNDDDATALINALTPGEPQANEGANPASETVAVARVPDGGARFDTNLYVAQTPTPGATNVLPNTFANWIAGFSVGGLTGFNDDFDNDGLGNAIENILGSSPAVAGQGLSAVSSSGGNLLFRHTLNAAPANDLQAAYEWSTDLATWQASAASAGGTTVTFGEPVEINAGPPALVEVTATITGTTPGKVFARLKVEQN